MSLKLYFNLLNQSSRAVYTFLKINNISFTPQIVQLNQGVYHLNEFKELSLIKSLPVIDDDGFLLSESVAILRYLCREKPVDDFWFPKENRKQARVDEYLEWQHHNTEFLCDIYFQFKCLKPLQGSKVMTEEQLEPYKDRMTSCLDRIEELWLADRPYLAGECITVADILASSDIEQIKFTGVDPYEDRPLLKKWMDSVKMKLNPVYSNIYSQVDVMAKNTFKNL